MCARWRARTVWLLAGPGLCNVLRFVQFQGNDLMGLLLVDSAVDPLERLLPQYRLSKLPVLCALA